MKNFTKSRYIAIGLQRLALDITLLLCYYVSTLTIPYRLASERARYQFSEAKD